MTYIVTSMISDIKHNSTAMLCTYYMSAEYQGNTIGLTLYAGGFVTKYFRQMALQFQEISPIMAMT